VLHRVEIRFKKYESLIVMQLNEPQTTMFVHPDASTGSDINSMGHMVNNKQSPNDVINRYKEIIRSQDETIAKCQKEIVDLKYAVESYRGKTEEYSAEINQLRSQLVLTQAHRDAFQANSSSRISMDDHTRAMTEKDNIIRQLELQLQQRGQFLNSNASVKNPVQEELVIKLEEENKIMVDELEKARKDQEDLLELLTEQDTKIATLKETLKKHNIAVESDPDTPEESHNENGHNAEDTDLNFLL